MVRFCLADKHDKYCCLYCKFSELGVPTKDLPAVVWGFFKDKHKTYSGHGCDCCSGVDEPYMVNNALWRKAKLGDRFLCLACLERRLGRALTVKDFIKAPINYGCFGFDCRTYVRLGSGMRKAA